MCLESVRISDRRLILLDYPDVIAQFDLAPVQNELATARQEFVKASQRKNNQRKNVAGFLALAALMYNQQQYKDALQMYRRALRDHPGCPAEVRVGIAACQLKLGDIVSAQAAFERTLVLDPANADAHLGLAIIKFNSPNAQQVRGPHH